MEKLKFRVKFLFYLSVGLAVLASIVHIYIIYSTYELAKENYVKEVTDTMESFSMNSAVSSVNIASFEKIKLLLREYADKKISKKVLYKEISQIHFTDKAKGDSLARFSFNKSPQLSSTRYSTKFTQVELNIRGAKDTIRFKNELAFGAEGKEFKNHDIFSIAQVHSTGMIITEPLSDGPGNYTATIRRTEEIEISNWKGDLFKKMRHLYALVVGLILVESLIVYVVFNGFFREKRLSDLKTDFANNITHELQTPLTSMSLIFKSIALPEVQSDKLLYDEYMDSLNRQYVKIQDTVNSVLESTFSEKDQLALDQTEIEEYLACYAKRFLMDKHYFRADIASQNVMVLINPLSLEKVLDNLIQNAIKYTPEGSQISLTGKPEKTSYVIRISDNGPGIGKKHQALIFDKFYRVSEQNEHSVKGLGLGLYLCKQAIINMKGTLVIDSEPGKGCEFIIKFPIYES